MYVNLSKLPDPPSRYQAVISGLYAGLNTSRIPSEIEDGQCSDLRNVLWKDGVLRSRDGQVAMPVNNTDVWHIADRPYSSRSIVPIAIHEKVWHNRLVFACKEDENEIGYIASYHLPTGIYERIYMIEESVDQMVGWNRGSFFQFGEDLYYKNCHTYVKMSITKIGSREVVVCKPVIGYVPVVMINTKANGIGDLYQPENRLSKYKEVWYNGDSGVRYST